MTQISVIPDTPAGPALRLELIRLLAPVTGNNVVEIATAAESYIIGEPLHRPVQTPMATSNTSRVEAGDRGDQPAEDGDLRRDAIIGNPAEDAAQALTPTSAPAHKATRHIQWTPERKDELHRLCEMGLEAAEIEMRMGHRDNSAFANAYRFGWIDLWREARERRRSGQTARQDAPETLPEPVPEPEVIVTRKDHGVEEADQPMPPSEEQRLIDEHIKSKGVTTTETDYGPDQPAVDALRRGYNDVVRSNDPKSPWLINGMRCTTVLLWKRANADLKARREKTIKRRA